MSAPAALPRSPGVPGRALATLAALSATLVAAFVAAPQLLASIGPDGGYAGSRQLTEALRDSFTVYWNSGQRTLSPDLERVVDYWFRYHLAKAAIAAILLVVLARLGILVWKTYAKANRPAKRAALAPAGVLITGLALFSLLAVMANIQGVVAPYSSLFPMLTDGATAPELTTALDQIRRQLSTPNGTTLPSVQLMIDDFARYHVAMAVIAATVAAAFVGGSALLWRRFAATQRPAKRTRRVLASFATLAVLPALALTVVAVANTMTAADSAPALLAFFEGGW